METETCQIRGQALLGSRYWMKNQRMDFHGPGSDWQWSKRHPGQRYGETCQKRRNEKRSKSRLSKNWSLTMQENCEVFTSLIQKMRNSRNLFKNERRKLEVPMPAAMLCKARGREYRETCSAPGICKTNYVCIVEADESTRKRMEGTLHKDHENHIAGKGLISLNRYDLVHKFIPVPQAMVIPQAKTAVDKELGKTWKDTGMAADESQKNNCGKVEADVTPGFEDRSKFFDFAESKCIQPSGDTQSTSQKVLILQEIAGKTVARDSAQNDAASSFQVWQKDAEREESTRRLVAIGTNQSLLNFRESSESTRRLAAFRAENSESVDGNDTVWPHNFHISTAYVFYILREYFRTCDRNLVANRETKWIFSMWTRQHGEYLWPPLFKPQFILESIMWRMNILPNISLSEHWDSCSMQQESWSRIRKKSKVYPRSTGTNKLGNGQHCSRIRQFSNQMQKPTYSATQYCVWEGSVKIRQSLEG